MNIVTINRKGSEPFGFSLRFYGNGLCKIGKVYKRSPAYRHGNICIGDRILAVNGRKIRKGDTLRNVRNAIKRSGFSITLHLSRKSNHTGRLEGFYDNWHNFP